MKKGDTVQVYIEKDKYPNTGIGYVEGRKIVIEDCFIGQGIEAQIQKKNEKRTLARKVGVIKKADYEQEPFCPHYGLCGGCIFQVLPYSKQLELKGREVVNQLKQNNVQCESFLGIEGSVSQFAYRNKMEYTFGDVEKGGEMALGMHKKNNYMSLVTVDHCKLVDEDFNLILRTVLGFFKEKNLPFYNKKSHEGLQRNLIVRKGQATDEILINIVTSSQFDWDKTDLVERLKNLENTGDDDKKLKGKLKGILHTINDNVADSVTPDRILTLWGEDYFYDEILGLKFKISPFSFFQTNTLTAERLYSQTLELIGDIDGKIVYDLYSGTGTIAQIMASKAKKVIGVELVEEAVEAAKINAALNNLDNCEFMAGDVFQVLDKLTATDDPANLPDTIVVDPPRVGIHPKALEKILSYGVEQIVYVSCNPQSLGTNLAAMQEAGYAVKAVKVFDQFPHTKHVETVVRLNRKP